MKKLIAVFIMLAVGITLGIALAADHRSYEPERYYGTTIQTCNRTTGACANIASNGSVGIGNTTTDGGTTATNGQVGISNGTMVIPKTISGDATLANTGALTISNNAISGPEITAGVINTAHLGSAIVNASKIEAGAVNASHIGSGVINTAHLGSGIVNASKIEAGAVNTSGLATDAVAATDIYKSSTALVINADAYCNSVAITNGTWVVSILQFTNTVTPFINSGVDSSNIVNGSVELCGDSAFPADVTYRIVGVR